MIVLVSKVYCFFCYNISKIRSRIKIRLRTIESVPNTTDYFFVILFRIEYFERSNFARKIVYRNLYRIFRRRFSYRHFCLQIALAVLLAVCSAAPRPSHLVYGPAVVSPAVTSYSAHSSTIVHPATYVAAPVVHSVPVYHSVPVVHAEPVVHGVHAISPYSSHGLVYV